MQWVLRAQVGDRDALEALMRAVQPVLRRYLARLVGQDADDLLQDILVIVIRKLHHLDDPKVFRPWTFRIASREAFRHVRKRRLWNERHEDGAGLEVMAGPAERPSGELLERLLATPRLSPASRAVLMLHFEQELSLPEVAAVLEIPLGTVKSRLAYGLAALRKTIDRTGG